MNGKAAPSGFTWCGKKGDLDLYLTHVQFDGDSAEHPALYIRNENRHLDKTNPITGQSETGCPAVVVPYRDFWIFRPEDRDSGGFARLEKMNGWLCGMSAALYGIDAAPYRFRIHDAILEFADDVKNLRPPPGMTAQAWQKKVEQAGLKLRVNGEQVR